MHTTFIARFTAWRGLAWLPSRGLVSRSPSPAEVATDLVVAQGLDRCTAWPTHRIRCFLHGQRNLPR